ncbi:hypothetical protein TIFTF001_016879 [Ficus carica]|uniref:Uncharacterized protein n=1 Tax=Ficus carica TaxID=3494 RepID=A0AA88A9K5_FICCA|nr:hypothetical protein TIFTF001_016879 [Ficus carica]
MNTSSGIGIISKDLSSGGIIYRYVIPLDISSREIISRDYQKAFLKLSTIHNHQGVAQGFTKPLKSLMENYIKHVLGKPPTPEMEKLPVESSKLLKSSLGDLATEDILEAILLRFTSSLMANYDGGPPLVLLLRHIALLQSPRKLQWSSTPLETTCASFLDEAAPLCRRSGHRCSLISVGYDLWPIAIMDLNWR